jgi:hypothetical protein
MTWLALAALLWTAPALAAEMDPLPEEVRACTQLVVPDTPRIWSVAFTTRSRDGAERNVRGNIFTRHDENERRVIVLRPTRPEELQGSTLMLLERDGPNEIFFHSPDLDRPKSIRGGGGSMGVFGTDFTYEDLERIYGLNRPGETRRLKDTVEGDRPAYILESTPAGGPGASAYEVILSVVDKETCIPLRTELYETNRRLRKILTINPQELRRDGSVWIAHELLMRDLLDESETRLIILSQKPVARFLELPEARNHGAGSGK